MTLRFRCTSDYEDKTRVAKYSKLGSMESRLRGRSRSKASVVSEEDGVFVGTGDPRQLPESNDVGSLPCDSGTRFSGKNFAEF
jgi:hypothetical protein